jgi:hypothetical protein
MTPAQEKNLRAMCGKRVWIAWHDPASDWNHFELMMVSPRDDTVYLKGADHPDGSKHDGDTFWADMGEIASIELEGGK